ncbi:MAG: glycosyltransferase family 2 protein [Pseudomonadota bacterium]|nr:glycosyltransferase family 2 protein [Pseudomonadota bacterium]
MLGLAATTIDDLDILPQFVSHHLESGIDRIAFWDMESKDGTTEWIQDHAGTFPITLLRSDANQNFASAKRREHLEAFLTDQEHCEWVIHSDVDEFWYSPTKRLSDVLERISGQDTPTLSCERVNRIAPASARISDADPDLFAYRFRVDRPLPGYFDAYAEDPGVDWALCRVQPKAIHHRIRKSSIAMGGHPSQMTSKPFGVEKNQICIDHFPFRSWPRFLMKVEHIMDFIRQNELGPKLAFHWQVWAKAYQSGELEAVYKSAFPTEENLSDLINSRIVTEVTSGPFSR